MPTWNKRKLVKEKVGPVDHRKNPRGLTDKVKVAIDAIVFDGCNRAVACKLAGMQERSFYDALSKTEVARYWNAQMQLRRQGERPNNIQRLTEIRDAANNMPAVNAVRLLEELTEAGEGRALPGADSPQSFQINIISRVEQQPRPPYLADREEFSPPPPAEPELVEEPEPAPLEPVFKWRRP